MLRAYDKATGQELGAVYMPAPQTGSPMTYFYNGKQYIVVAISGASYTGELARIQTSVVSARSFRRGGPRPPRFSRSFSSRISLQLRRYFSRSHRLASTRSVADAIRQAASLAVRRARVRDRAAGRRARAERDRRHRQGHVRRGAAGRHRGSRQRRADRKNEDGRRPTAKASTRSSIFGPASTSSRSRCRGSTPSSAKGSSCRRTSPRP